MAIQNRRGADADFDSHKMLPGEFAVTTDGTRKAYAAFAPGDVREIAFKDQVPIVGNITPAEVQTAVDNYLAENPVQAGATEEQAKQIELNRKNIEANKDKVSQLSNQNLFINGNFQIWSNGEEFTVGINSDGTYGGYQITADRWTVASWGNAISFISKTDKGLHLEREIATPVEVFQVLEAETLRSIIGKPLTMSYAIEDASGQYQEYKKSILLEDMEIDSVTGPFIIAEEYFYISLQTGSTLLWAKLEVGENATPCIPDAKDAIICRLEKDYIVEQGIDGIWTYRKWKSGIAECWACQSAEISIDKPWASLFYGSVQGAKFPNSLFVTEPQVYASVLNSSLWLTISDVSQESVGILYLTSAASYENINYTLNYKAIGRWK